MRTWLLLTLGIAAALLAAPVAAQETTPLGLYQQALRDADAGRTGEAYTGLQRAIELNEHFHAARLELGRIAIMGYMGNSAQGLHHLARLLEPADPQQAPDARIRGEAGRLLLEAHAAVPPATLVKAYQAAPGHPLSERATIRVAQALAGQGDTGGAVRLVGPLLERATEGSHIQSAARICLEARKSAEEKRALAEQWRQTAVEKHLASYWVAALVGIQMTGDAPLLSEAIVQAGPDLAESPSLLMWACTWATQVGQSARRKPLLEVAWTRHRRGDALQALLEAACGEGDRVRAEALIKEAMPAWENLRSYLIRAGAALAKAGWQDLARGIYEPAAAAGDYQAMTALLGDAAGDPERLREVLRKLAASHHDPSQMVYSAVQQIADGRDRRREAIALAEAAQKVLGESALLASLVARYALQEGQFEKAYDLLKRAAEGGGSDHGFPDLSSLVRAARNANRLPEAGALIRSLALKEAAPEVILVQAGRALKEAGDVEGALLATRRWVARFPAPYAYVQLLGLLGTTVPPEERRRLVEEATARYPDDPQIRELRRIHAPGTVSAAEDLKDAEAFFSRTPPMGRLGQTKDLLVAASVLHRNVPHERRPEWLRKHVGLDPQATKVIEAGIRFLDGDVSAFAILVDPDLRNRLAFYGPTAESLRKSGHEGIARFTEIAPLLSQRYGYSQDAVNRAVSAWLELPEAMALAVARSLPGSKGMAPGSDDHLRQTLIQAFLARAKDPGKPLARRLAEALALAAPPGVALFAYTNHLQSIGEKARAAKMIVEAAARARDNAMAQRGCAQQLRRLGEPDAAMECYRHADAATKTPYRDERRMLYMEMLQLLPDAAARMAETQRREEAATNPPTPSALLALADWHSAIGNRPAAIAKTQQALGMPMEPDEIRCAVSALAKHDPSMALPYVQRLLDAPPNPKWPREPADTLFLIAAATRRYDEGTEWLTTVAKRGGASETSARSGLAALRALAGDMDGARTVLVESGPVQRGRRLATAALRLLQVQQPRKAILELATALLPRLEDRSEAGEILSICLNAARQDAGVAAGETADRFQAAADAALGRAANRDETRWLRMAVFSDLGYREAGPWARWSQSFVNRAFARELELTGSAASVVQGLQESVRQLESRKVLDSWKVRMEAALAAFSQGRPVTPQDLLRLLEAAE